MTKLEIWKVVWYDTSKSNKFYLEVFKPFHDSSQSQIIADEERSSA